MTSSSLKTKAQPTRLTLQTAASGRRHRVAPHSAIGAMARQSLDCQITLISDAGHTFDALIFVEVELGEIKQVYLSAFAMLQPDTDYRLIGIDRHVDPAKLVELDDPIFYPGTQITLTDGSLCAVEDLTPGQKFSPMISLSKKCLALRSKPNVRRVRTVRLGSQSPILAPIRISSSAQNIAFYVPKPMAAMGDGSSKPKTCAMALTIDWVAAGFVDCVQIRFAI